jgi:hypothetical protein
MSAQLFFSEEFRYRDDPTGISVPVILSHAGQSFRDLAKVDTGAEVCLFKHEIGLKLGLAVEQGMPISLGTLAGPLEGFGHEVVLQTGELIFQSVVYFAKYPGLPRNILGRRGWLRNLRLAVIDYNNLLYLSAYDE